MIRYDWTARWGKVSKLPTAAIHCVACRNEFELEDFAYKIDHVGHVSPSPVHCPKCRASNGDIMLAGWPPPIDFNS